jgi:hypothetical protein
LPLVPSLRDGAAVEFAAKNDGEPDARNEGIPTKPGCGYEAAPAGC